MLTIDTITTASWPDIASLMTGIIARRKFTKTTERTNRGTMAKGGVFSTKTTIELTRSLRISDVAKELKIPSNSLHAYLKSGITPNARNASKAKAWCEKYYEVLK